SVGLIQSIVRISATETATMLAAGQRPIVQTSDPATNRWRGRAVVQIEPLAHELIAVAVRVPHQVTKQVITQVFELIAVTARSTLHKNAANAERFLIANVVIDQPQIRQRQLITVLLIVHVI